MRVWILSAGLALLCMAQLATAGTVLIVGDSISAGFGLDTRQGWVSLLQARLKTEGFDSQVVNASISGDTSAGARRACQRCLQSTSPRWWCLSWAATMACAGSCRRNCNKTLLR